MRRDLAVRELPSQIAASALVTEADVDSFIRLRDQSRSFRYLALDAPVVTAEQISDEEAKTYCLKNPAQIGDQGAGGSGVHRAQRSNPGGSARR